MRRQANRYRFAVWPMAGAGIALVVWSALGFVDRFFPGLMPGPDALEPIVVKTADNSSRATSYDVNKIVSAHLFGEAEKVVVKKNPETAPRTKLKLNLVGVMASGDENYARAMIQVGSKEMKTYAIGEVIEGTDAQLYKVEPGKVILDRKGNLESLVMVLEKTDIEVNMDDLPQATPPT